MTEIDQRILLLIPILKDLNMIESGTDFATSIGMKKQNLNNIKNGIASFRPNHIKNICKTFNVNANWIFSLQENVFRK